MWPRSEELRNAQTGMERQGLRVMAVLIGAAIPITEASSLQGVQGPFVHHISLESSLRWANTGIPFTAAGAAAQFNLIQIAASIPCRRWTMGVTLEYVPLGLPNKSTRPETETHHAPAIPRARGFSRPDMASSSRRGGLAQSSDSD